MERDWTWIYTLVPIKEPIREVWLRVGRLIEQFGIRLGRWEYLVAVDRSYILKNKSDSCSIAVGTNPKRYIATFFQ